MNEWHPHVAHGPIPRPHRPQAVMWAVVAGFTQIYRDLTENKAKSTAFDCKLSRKSKISQKKRTFERKK